MYCMTSMHSLNSSASSFLAGFVALLLLFLLRIIAYLPAVIVKSPQLPNSPTLSITSFLTYLPTYLWAANKHNKSILSIISYNQPTPYSIPLTTNPVGSSLRPPRRRGCKDQLVQSLVCCCKFRQGWRLPNRGTSTNLSVRSTKKNDLPPSPSATACPMRGCGNPRSKPIHNLPISGRTRFPSSRPPFGFNSIKFLFFFFSTSPVAVRPKVTKYAGGNTLPAHAGIQIPSYPRADRPTYNLWIFSPVREAEIGISPGVKPVSRRNKPRQVTRLVI